MAISVAVTPDAFRSFIRFRVSASDVEAERFSPFVESRKDLWRWFKTDGYYDSRVNELWNHDWILAFGIRYATLRSCSRSAVNI